MRAISAAAALVLAALATGCPGAPPPPPPQPEGAAPIAADTAIRLGRLVNPADSSEVEGAIVLIKDGRITHVGRDASRIPSTARVIDWSRYTGLPGLVDAHTHIGFASDEIPGMSPWERMKDLDDEAILAIARKNALAALSVGVTTMIDKGCSTGVDSALRQEIEANATPGPRLFLAKAGLFRGAPNASERGPGTIINTADIVPEIEREVKDGSDLIKLWSDWCSDRAVDCQQTFNADELKIAVDEAHRRGKTIAIHAYHGAAARDAVFAGADAVDHPINLDKETMAEMARRGVVYIPTVDHNRYYRENAALFGTSHIETAALGSYIGENLETVRAAHRAGVRVAMGSDAVFTMFGQNTRELTWLVKAGMTTMEALRAATVNGAASIGKDREIGAVAPGYLADIIAVEGDPLADINAAITGVRGVMVGGRLLIPPPAGAKAAPPTSKAPPLAPDVPEGADASRDAELKKQAQRILGAFENSGAAFVPGGAEVVYVSDRDGLPQLYVGDVKKPSAAPRRLITTTDRAADPRVTPDGKSVVFRSDRGHSSNWSLFRVDINGANLVELTPGVELDRDAPFLPAKASPPMMVYCASLSSESEWRRRVITQELSPGAKPRLVFMSPLPGGLTDVSSDGKRALLMRRPSSTSSSIALVDLTSGAVEALYPPPNKTALVASAVFADDGRRVIVAEDDGGERVVLVAIDAATGEEKARRVEPRPAAPSGIDLARSPSGDKVALRRSSGDHTEIQLLDPMTLKVAREVLAPLGAGGLGMFSPDGKRLSISWSTFTAPPDIYFADTNTGKLTPIRDEARADARLAGLPDVAVSITEIPSFDGSKIPTNLYLPVAKRGGVKPAPAPVIVMIHNGPADSAKAAWDGTKRFYAAQGYAIVEPNVRGSTGFGRAYELADNGARRTSAIRDVDSVATWALAQPWADKDRAVIFGAGYGGYIALLELSRLPSRFRAGVDLFGLVSLRGALASKSGRTSPSLAAELGDPIKDAEFLDSISPLANVASIKAPLFVYAAAADPRAPRRDTDHLVRALRERGVPVEYMVAVDEGHSLRRFNNQVEAAARAARFLEKALARRGPDAP